MVQVLHASVKGRARYKIKGLYRSEPFKRYIESNLTNKEGIRYFSANLYTGNILVLFNTNHNVDSIKSLFEFLALEYKKGNNGSQPPQVSHLKPSKTKKDSPIPLKRLRRAVVRSEDQPVKEWHLIEAKDLLEFFKTSKSSGLKNEQVKENLKRYGPNILPESLPRSKISILFDQFKSLPVILLTAAAGLSVVTGGIADAIVIMSVVFINGAIGYITESQSEKTIHSLKRLIRPTALVIRNNALLEISSEDVVLGDLLVLRPGSYVASDARLIEAQNLSVDESALTGESMPVIKTTESLRHKVISKDTNYKISNKTPYSEPMTDIPLADRTNMVYMGTLVTGGQGIAVVVATGRFTEIGKIQTLVGEARTPETPMQRQLNKLGTQLTILGGAVCGIVFLMGLLRGYGLLQMLKTSISLAVAAIPEGLPVVATTTLALGIRNMRRQNVLIRRLDAVETLGAVQTICLDKTGTLTLNKMTVLKIHTGMKSLRFNEGRFFSDEPEKKNTECINKYNCDELLKLIYVSVLCNESEVIKYEGEYKINGTSTENALIHMAIKSGIDVFSIRQKFPLKRILHRSENRNFMVTIHSISIHGIQGHYGLIIAIKGSPSEVLSLCSFYMRDGQKIQLTETEKLEIEIENEKMAGDALRILGIAYAFIGAEYAAQLEDIDKIDIESLISKFPIIWLGLVGMADPLRSGLKELINLFHKAGIDTVMITGDQSPTAYAIGKELNLSKGEELEILDSTHLPTIKPEVLNALIKRVHIFSRVSPAHKLQIVQSLQRTGKIVAMTGDGINDGPALKVADIGIAMGHTGTDVAREVADVILEDDNIETMIIAIGQGRTIYSNIRKSLHFLLSTNMSEIMVMFAGIAGGLGQPLSALQLLWINLISDIAPGLALALEPPEPDVLTRPPRNPDEQIMKSSDFKNIALESAVLSTGALSAYGYGILRYGIGPRAGTMAFFSLTLGQLLHSISCRSESHSIFDKGSLKPNRHLTAALTGSILMQSLLFIVPGLRGLFGITPIGLSDAIIIGAGAGLPFLINESIKKIKR